MMKAVPGSTRRLLRGAILVGVLCLAPAVHAESRHPTKREMFFHYAAVMADLPELCEKISAEAQYTVGFGPPGHQIHAVRSKCYYDTAIRYSDRALCAKVKPVSTLFLSGRAVSPGGCRDSISARHSPMDPIVPDEATVIAVFAEMGYTADTAVKELPVKPLFNAQSKFLDLRHRPDLEERLVGALTSTQEVLPADQDLLLDMAAHVTNDVAWCRKIKPGVRHPREKKSGQTFDMDYRETCIFEVALNSRNAAYCDELPSNPSPDRPEWSRPAANCRSYVEQYKLPQFKDRPYFYGYHASDDPAQRTRIYRLLGYAEPRDSDLPPGDIAARYRYLLRDIGEGRVSRADPGVAALLARLKQLK